MHRLPRTQLLDMIAVILATASKDTKRRMQSKIPIEADQGRDEMAKLIVGKIDNGSSMVIVTEMVGEAHVAERGQWGVHEEAPALVPGSPNALSEKHEGTTPLK